MGGYKGTLFSMEGRVAIVTGGSKGIGRAIAQELARAGASVTIAARNPDTLDQAAAALRSEGLSVHAVAADVTSREDIARLVDETVREFGPVDTLVNNVGGGRGPGFTTGPLGEIDASMFDSSMQYNVRSHLFAAQLVAPMMMEKGKGSIITIASTAGRPYRLPQKNQALYSLAKAAVVQLTVSMAIEWGPTIRSNCIAPGLVMTDAGSSRTTPEQRDALLDRLALGRFGDPVDCAGAGLFLASDASSWLTGAVLDLNGGAGYKPYYAPKALVE